MARAEYDPEVIADLILKRGHYKDWFVLTRTNAELDSILTYLTMRGIPCDTFKRAKISEEEFAKKMAQDTVKVLTIHTSKGLEAKYVVVIGAKNWSPEEKRIQYVAATRAMDFCFGRHQSRRRRKICRLGITNKRGSFTT